MISACKKAVSETYRLIGEAQVAEAAEISERLGRCLISDACPFDRSCARTLAVLRRDVASCKALSPVISSGSFLETGDGAA